MRRPAIMLTDNPQIKQWTIPPYVQCGITVILDTHRRQEAPTPRKHPRRGHPRNNAPRQPPMAITARKASLRGHPTKATPQRPPKTTAPTPRQPPHNNLPTETTNHTQAVHKGNRPQSATPRRRVRPDNG